MDRLTAIVVVDGRMLEVNVWVGGCEFGEEGGEARGRG